MIGIIGTGWGTRVQVPAFRAAALPITALAARDAQKRCNKHTIWRSCFIQQIGAT